MDVGTLLALAGLNPRRYQREHLVIAVSSESTVRSRAPSQVEQCVFVPILCGGFGDDLLSQDVDGRLGWQHRVEHPTVDRGEHGDCLDQLITCRRVDTTHRLAMSTVTRTPDALQEGRDRTRRSDLTDQFNRTDVDAEFERRRCDQRLEITGPEPGFDPSTSVL